jgi:cell division transport system permease protein
MGIIAMRHNRTGYYIREGISSIFTHGFMSFASVCIIVACLLIMGSFSLLALNVDGIIDTMESQNQILAYVDENLSEADARALETRIEAIDNVNSAQFVSRDEAMQSFVDSYENSSLFDGLDSSVFRHRFVIYVDDISLMEQTQTAIANVSGIARVNAHLEISRGFVRIRNIVSAVSVVLVAILFVISLFIMSNTIKLTTFERKDEIAIMKMVGATSSFIRWPFVIEGLILGLIGSLTAFLLQWGVYQLVLGKLVSGSGISFLTVLPFSTVAVPLLIAFGVVGLGVGVIGSLMAIKNYLKV